MRFSPHKRGFTLIELLVVLVIFGVMAGLITTSLVGSSEVANVRSAARGFVQLSRYARTMAVLHQKPMTFSFSESGQLRVTLHGGASGATSLVSARAFATTNTLLDAEATAAAEAEKEEITGGVEYSMADIEASQNYKQVKIIFVEYLDIIDDGWSNSKPLPKDSKSVTNELEEVSTQMQIVYLSNGTCRPYRVQIAADEGDSYALTISIDRLGVAKIDEDEEESQ
jgi:prepilin-type N-terminal cleavage/methylation domain-containing protein